MPACPGWLADARALPGCSTGGEGSVGGSEGVRVDVECLELQTYEHRQHAGDQELHQYCAEQVKAWVPDVRSKSTTEVPRSSVTRTAGKATRLSVWRRQIRRRPQVSATHLPGEELAVMVHGCAVVVESSVEHGGGFRRALLSIYVPRYGAD